MHTAKVSSDAVICSLQYIDDSTSELLLENIKGIQTSSIDLKINVSIPIFAIGFLCFLSYFLLVLFGGVGLPSLPFDLIYAFISRPNKIDSKNIDYMKKHIVEVAAEIKGLAMKVKTMEKNEINKKSMFSSEKREYNQLVNKVKSGVSCVEEEFEIVNNQKEYQETGVLKLFLSLFLGILSAIVTFLWVLQLIIHVVVRPNGKPFSRGLNAMLIYFTERNLSFISIGIFVIFCLYLLLCAMKGNFKFGLRFPFIGSIHPMKKDDTLMDSILFNISLIMFTSISVNNFCFKAFSDYASMTDYDIIFNTQIKHLFLFKLFEKYHIFEYALFGIMFITLVYSIFSPSDKKKAMELIYKTDTSKINTKSNNNTEGTSIEMNTFDSK